ncbi:hypothetical protein Glove_137g120 [Diversispora epigaea]|uniref:Uncharacterized protein n=1 Tax=Diversispora epigaea TaxID=1348612 RepID=A0A397IWD7_9GLOM|nr:hypothetical protein Glove_137g120 [Diversispora epigaea]
MSKRERRPRTQGRSKKIQVGSRKESARTTHSITTPLLMKFSNFMEIVEEDFTQKKTPKTPRKRLESEKTKIDETQSVLIEEVDNKPSPPIKHTGNG